MNAKQGARSYVDFEPSSEWSRGEESDILRVHLPGFKKEHIKVQVDSYGNLRTTGERPLEDNRWSRFWKDFHIPADYPSNEIRAKFENETLFITLPKEIAHATAPPKSSVPNKLPTPSKPTPAPPKPAPVADQLPKPAVPKPKPAVPEPKPAVDQASIAAGLRDGPTTGKLREMLSTKKEETKVDDNKVKGTTAASPVIGDKRETDTKEEKPVEEKRSTDKKPSFTEAVGAGVGTGPTKEPDQASGVVTGIVPPRQGFLLNVAVAVIVLVGIAFYWSFKLRKEISDHGDHNSTQEL
ncbi:uncharacterized protein LOC144572505 [Carex rostrata]